jgi:glycosyltransferase involved in cell wall biosynthesis
VDSTRKSWLVVPCYNEANRLPAAEFHSLLIRRPDLTLVFVDDGSTDTTPAVIEGLRAAEGSRVVVHRLERNSGKGEAVRCGLGLGIAHGATLLGFADADLSTPIGEIVRMFERMETSDAAALLGARVRLLGRNIQRRAHRHYLGRVFATVASFALGVPIYDTQCGAKLFRRTDALEQAVRSPFHSRWIFDVELLERLLSASQAGGAPLKLHEIEELPLREWRDVAGSKLRARAMVASGLQLIGLLVRRRVATLRARRSCTTEVAVIAPSRTNEDERGSRRAAGGLD